VRHRAGEDHAVGDAQLLGQAVQLAEAVAGPDHDEGHVVALVEEPAGGGEEELAVLSAVELPEVHHHLPLEVVPRARHGPVEPGVEALEVGPDVGLEDPPLRDAEAAAELAQRLARHRDGVHQARHGALAEVDQGAHPPVAGAVVEDLVLPVVPVVVDGQAAAVGGGDGRDGHRGEALLEVHDVGPARELAHLADPPHQREGVADHRDGLEAVLLPRRRLRGGDAGIEEVVDQLHLVPALDQLVGEVGDPHRPGLERRGDVVRVQHEDAHQLPRLLRCRAAR